MLASAGEPSSICTMSDYVPGAISNASHTQQVVFICILPYISHPEYFSFVDMNLDTHTSFPGWESLSPRSVYHLLADNLEPKPGNFWSTFKGVWPKPEHRMLLCGLPANRLRYQHVIKSRHWTRTQCFCLTPRNSATMPQTHQHFSPVITKTFKENLKMAYQVIGLPWL